MKNLRPLSSNTWLSIESEKEEEEEHLASVCSTVEESNLALIWVRVRVFSRLGWEVSFNKFQ